MEKNTILAIVLSMIVLMGSMFIQAKFFPQEEIATAPVQTEQTAISDVNTNVVNNSTFVSDTSNLFVEQEESEILKEEHFTIKTNVVEVVFTNKGGDIISYKLLNYSDNNECIQMADNISEINRAFSISLGGVDNAKIDEIFNVKRISDNSIGFYKTLALKNADGSVSKFTLVKQYTFQPDEYVFKLDVTIDGGENFYGLNVNNCGYTISTFPQIGPVYDQKNDKYEYRNFMSYTDDKKKKQMLTMGQTKEYNKPYLWTGVAGKYFTVLVSPANQDFNKSFYSMKYGSRSDYSDAQVSLTRNVLSSSKAQDTFYVYVGPRTENLLKKYNNANDNAWNLSNLRLNDSMESSNIFGWFEAIIKWFLELFYKLIPNWGVSIIIVTILVKLALFPLTKKSSLAQLKMQEVQPRMQEIQAKYKGNPEKMNAEMAKLYQETGYNPMSGCLPMLIQIPIIWAMYNLFNNYFEFRGAMFIPGWIPDLSVGDKVYTFSFNLPFLGNELHILPIIYVFSQIIFTKITQSTTPGNQQQQTSMKIMMYGMPIFFFFIFYNAPSGLILYWTLSNFLQLVQQKFINRMMKQKRAEMEKNKLKVVNSNSNKKGK